MADTFSLQMIGRLDRKNTEMIHFIEKIIILEKLCYLPQEIVALLQSSSFFYSSDQFHFSSESNH